MIHIRNLHFGYPRGDFHLSIADFKIAKREKVAVIGPSGSGKTTLLNLVAGICMPDSGTIVAGNDHISDFSDTRRRDFRITRIGFVFQNFELLDYLNVLDNILHPFRITSALKMDEAVRQRAVELAGELGLEGKLKQQSTDLSQGEKQRAAICRALLPRPQIILADEATGNLDPENKRHIIDLLFRAVQQHEATLLAVTHDHELLTRFDRIVDFKDFQGKSS